MNVRSQRRIAAEILKCGHHRVWIDPYYLDEVSMAITREDIRELIGQKIIQKRYKKGIAKHRARERHERKKRGLARGVGKRKGGKHSVVSKKDKWIQTIRPIRRQLKYMRNTGEITPQTYRKLYRQAKGGLFTSTSHMLRYIDEHKLRK